MELDKFIQKLQDIRATYGADEKPEIVVDSFRYSKRGWYYIQNGVKDEINVDLDSLGRNVIRVVEKEDLR